MNILIAAATDAEIAPLNAYFQTASLPGTVTGGVIITGVGMLNTTYEITKHLQATRYDLVLQVGVAGSYVNTLKPGDVVFVTSDQYGDLGAEDNGSYLDKCDTLYKWKTANTAATHTQSHKTATGKWAYGKHRERQ